ncbi:MAG: beta-propeller fold lactonase family protein [Chloroflexia bacterium]
MQRLIRLSLTLTLLLSAFAWGGGAASAEGDDLTAGAVYTLTNAPDHNEVVAYSRAADGTLSPMDKFDTGGIGTGLYENSDTMLVVGSSEGQSSPINLGGGSDLLFAANAGSDNISVFAIQTDGSLELVETEASGGERPISLTVKNGVLYVLNSAGDDLPGAGFCYGAAPEITGFWVAESGELSPIPDSTRKLLGAVGSGCAQVTFNPAGDVLVVSEIGADIIDTFTVGSNGVANGPIRNETSGLGPFALAFDSKGRLVTTENFGAAEEKGAVASYSLGDDGNLSPVGDSVPVGETDTCWILVSPDGKYAYTTSFGPLPFLDVDDESSRRGSISSFHVGDDGSLELIDAAAGDVGVGAVDITFGGGGRYIYALNTLEGKIKGWSIESGGALTPITSVGGVPTSMPGPQSGGIAAYDGDHDSSGGETPEGMPSTGGGGLSPAPAGFPTGALAALALTLLAAGQYTIGRRRS